MADKTVKILFEGQDKVSKPVGNMNKALDNTEKSGKRAGGGLSVFKQTLASILSAKLIQSATKGLWDFGKSLIDSAMEEEQAFTSIRQAVENTGSAWEDAEGKLTEYVKKQMQTTQFGEEEQLEGLQALTEATGDYNKAIDLMTLAEDLSVAKHMDLRSAADLVGKVASGNIGTLSRYGIQLEKGTSASEALAEMQKRFGGQAEAAGKTGAGAIKRMNNILGETKDVMGKALLPSIGKVASWITDFVIAKTPQLEKFAGVVGEWLAGAFEKVSGWAQAAGQWIEGVKFNLPGAVETLKELVTTGEGGSFAPLINLMASMGLNVENARLWGTNIGLAAQGVGQLANGIPPEAWEKLGVPDWVINGIINFKDTIESIGGIAKTAFAGLMGEDIWEDQAAHWDPTQNIFVEEKPGLKAQLIGFGKRVVGWIAEGLGLLNVELAGMADKFSEWAEGDGRVAAQEFGSNLGGKIVDFFGQELVVDENTDKAATAFGNMLADSILKIDLSVNSLIAAAMGSMFARMFEDTFLEQYQDEIQEGVEQFFVAWLTSISPMALSNVIYGKFKQALSIVGGWLGIGGGGGGGESGLPFMKKATGFSGIVSKPTLMMVGEGGTERVSVRPTGGQPSGGGNSIVFNIYTNSAQAAGDAVMQRLRARGLA